MWALLFLKFIFNYIHTTRISRWHEQNCSHHVPHSINFSHLRQLACILVDFEILYIGLWGSMKQPETSTSLETVNLALKFGVNCHDSWGIEVDVLRGLGFVKLNLFIRTLSIKSAYFVSRDHWACFFRFGCARFHCSDSKNLLWNRIIWRVMDE